MKSVIALFIGILFTVSSCQDVLNVSPKDSLTGDAVFQDPALLEAFVNYAYRILPHGFQETGGTSPLSFATTVDESHYKTNVAVMGNIWLGLQRPDNMPVLDVWTNDRAITHQHNKSYWNPIKQANEFLANVTDSDIDPVLLTRLTGEIKTIRAYSYFRLISNFGGVPLVTEPFTLDNWQVTRDSYDDVLNFVLRELDEAIEMLPTVHNAANLGKLTKGAAMAIKARALLYAASPLNNPSNDLSKWQAAADAAKAVIDLQQYELYPDYQVLFTEEGEHNNSELIWGRHFFNLVNTETNVDRRLFPNGWAGHGHAPPTHNVVDDFEMLSGLLPKDDPEYDPQDPYVNRDPRFYATISYNGAPWKERTIETFAGGLDSNQGPRSPFNASETGYNMRKFISESTDDLAGGNSNPPWPYFRYAEVLLNYAEAMYELGDEDTAREYVNMVRKRPSVNMPDITESGEALWERIVHERRIELVFEEHRFYDVRRWKIAEDVLSKTRTRMRITKDPDTGVFTYEVVDHHPANFNAHNYLSPIPLAEIEKNPLLEQNPGY